MRFTLSAGVLLSGCLTGLLAENRPPHLTVTLLIQSVEDIAPAALQVMEAEVSQIYEPYGIAVSLFRYRPGGSTPVMERAIVVKLCGNCGTTVGPLREEAQSGAALAFTHSVDGHLLPFVEVMCGRIKGLLLDRNFSDSHLPLILYGRALARVVAHEMFHVLANTKRHTDHGVMRAHLSARDLTSQSLYFDRVAGEKLTSTLFSRAKTIAAAVGF